MFAIGNKELDNYKVIVKKGDILLHTNTDGSSEEVILEYGTTTKDGIEVESETLGFYKTKDGTIYLASLKGKLIERANLKFIRHGDSN